MILRRCLIGIGEDEFIIKNMILRRCLIGIGEDEFIIKERIECVSESDS